MMFFTAMDFLLQKVFLKQVKAQCVKAAREIGFPVVMKIVSPDIIHKSDAGGVKVGLKNDDEVRVAFTTIMDNSKKYNAHANIEGVIVQEMVKSGKETNSWCKTGSIIWTTCYGWSWRNICRSP